MFADLTERDVHRRPEMRAPWGLGSGAVTCCVRASSAGCERVAPAVQDKYEQREDGGRTVGSSST